MTRFLTVAATLGVAVLLGLGATAEAGQKKKKKAAETPAAGTVTGTIQKVSDDGKTITVEAPGGKKKKPASTTEVKIADATKIEYVGIDAKDDQKLKLGYAVTVTLNETAKDTAAAVKVSKAGEPVAKKKKKKADK
jgi:hypothetical protein